MTHLDLRVPSLLYTHTHLPVRILWPGGISDLRTYSQVLFRRSAFSSRCIDSSQRSLSRRLRISEMDCGACSCSVALVRFSIIKSTVVGDSGSSSGSNWFSVTFHVGMITRRGRCG